MHIGLHDAEAEHIKRKHFPNYALMKISAYHKAQGDTVEWWSALNNPLYDIVYSSKVFDFTPENPYLPENTIKGGTGYNVKSQLAPEIDGMFPDYWTQGLENASPSEKDIDRWCEIFETHRQVTAPRKKPKTRNQIRKWLKNPISNSAAYKMWGNSLAIPCAYTILAGIAEELQKLEKR